MMMTMNCYNNDNNSDDVDDNDDEELFASYKTI